MNLPSEAFALVTRLAVQMARRLPPWVERADLEQAALLRIWAVLPRYSPEAGAFAPWAATQARGAMLDELRRADHLERYDRIELEKLRAVRVQLEHEGVPVTSAALAVRLGATTERVEALLLLEAPPADESAGESQASDEPGPEEICAGRQSMFLLATLITELPEPMRTVMRRRVMQQQEWAQIGADMGFSASWACALARQAATVLRQRLDTSQGTP